MREIEVEVRVPRRSSTVEVTLGAIVVHPVDIGAVVDDGVDGCLADALETVPFLFREAKSGLC